MKCPKCGSENVTISLVQSEGKSKHQGVGFGGHVNNAARGLTAVCTLGMSNLVWKKSKGGTKTEIITDKVCLCQSCGASWQLEK